MCENGKLFSALHRVCVQIPFTSNSFQFKISPEILLRSFPVRWFQICAFCTRYASGIELSYLTVDISRVFVLRNLSHSLSRQCSQQLNAEFLTHSSPHPTLSLLQHQKQFRKSHESISTKLYNGVDQEIFHQLAVQIFAKAARRFLKLRAEIASILLSPLKMPLRAEFTSISPKFSHSCMHSQREIRILTHNENWKWELFARRDREKRGGEAAAREWKWISFIVFFQPSNITSTTTSTGLACVCNGGKERAGCGVRWNGSSSIQSRAPLIVVVHIWHVGKKNFKIICAIWFDDVAHSPLRFAHSLAPPAKPSDDNLLL